MNTLLKQLQPDIFPTRNTATLEMQLVAWWRRVKLRIHGEHGWDVKDMHGQNPTYRKLRKLLKPFIHQYVALSSEAKNYLLNIIKVKPEKVNHICNGVDTNKFSPGEKNDADLPKNFMQPELLVFGTVGRLAEVKNQTLLLESFIALVKMCGDKAEKLRLIIVGDGVLMSSLVATTKNAGLTEQVFFAGNRSDVAQLMKHFDVFVLPSLAEGISNTILEAMACGLPVIATHVGGNPDLIKQTLHESHLVEPTDNVTMVAAMEQYIDRADLLRLNSKKVRDHCVQNFSIDTMVNKYHQLYQTFNG
jgi:sugar transferase (PEP-CTERM/EpsH1 system associated)